MNLFGNTDGLLHISKISHHRVDKVEDVLKLGDVIDVKVTEIDNKGRINVSAKLYFQNLKQKKKNGSVKLGTREKRVLFLDYVVK